MTVTSRLWSSCAGADIFREGIGLFAFGVGGRGFSGGLISKTDFDRVGSSFGSSVVKGPTGVLVFLFRGSGDGDSAPELGGGAIIIGDRERGEGGGRRGLFGRPGRPGSGLFGGSNGLEIPLEKKIGQVRSELPASFDLANVFVQCKVFLPYKTKL